jgi:hypothetical protein
MGGWGTRSSNETRSGRIGTSPSSGPLRSDSAATYARGKGRVHRGDGLGQPPPIGPIPAAGQPVGQMPPDGEGLTIKHR